MSAASSEIGIQQNFALLREWSRHAKGGYPATFGDTTASGAALAFLMS